jgi:hypothetical protein
MIQVIHVTKQYPNTCPRKKVPTVCAWESQCWWKKRNPINRPFERNRAVYKNAKHTQYRRQSNHVHMNSGVRPWNTIRPKKYKAPIKCFVKHQEIVVRPMLLMTSPFMPLHITSDAERFPTAMMRAFEWLLSRMTVAMYPQAAGPRESLITGLTNIAILRLRECRMWRRCGVMMMVPRVRISRWCHRDRYH